MKILTPGNGLPEQPEKETAKESEKEIAKQPEKETAKKQISLRNLLRKLLLLVFVSMFLFSLFKLANKLYAYQKENKTYESIRASIQYPDGVPGFTNPTPEPADATGEPESSQVPEAAEGMPSPPPLPYTVLKGDPNELNPEGIFKVYSALKAQNADLVGWISMPGFRKVINYPVMQSRDNEFYLTHDFYKNKSYSGSIFMDACNTNTEPDRNIILYSHAMKDISMFGNLRDYPDNEEKYGKYTTIYLDFLNMHLEYQVFSAYSTESSFNYRRTTFTDDADFLSFLETIKGKSEHDFGVSLLPQDKIITLSTCDESYGKDGRTVIHAKLVKQMIYNGSGIEGDYANADGESDKKIISSNVYLETLLLQYQVTNADDSQNNADPQTTTQSAPGKSPDDELPTAPDTSQVPSTSPAPDTGKADISPAIQWKDAVLDPPFTITGKVFSTKVPAAADIAKLTVTTDDPKASLSYTLNGKAADPGMLALSEGDNEIIVRVVSIDDLYARTYTIHVLREPSPTTSQPEQTPSIATEPAASVSAAANQP